jgi:hypothetical protein
MSFQLWTLSNLCFRAQQGRIFGLILLTKGGHCPGTFKTVKELLPKIEQFVNQSGRKSHPFAWAATADSILEEIE